MKKKAKRTKYVMRDHWSLGFLGILGIPGVIGLFINQESWTILLILFFLWFIPIKKK